MPVLVGRTDEEALQEGGPHIEALFKEFMAFPFEMLMPPGYASLEAMRASLTMQEVGGRGGGERVCARELNEKGIVIIESANSVRRGWSAGARKL